MAGEKNRQFLSINVEILKFTSLWHETDQVKNKRKYLKILAITLALLSTFTPLFCEFIAVLIDLNPAPDIVDRIQVVLAEVCLLGALYMVACFIRHRSDIKDLVNSIADFKKFSNLDLEAVDEKASFFSKVVLIYSLTGMVTYTLSPLLSQESCEMRKSQYRIDHGIPCGIIVPLRLPLKRHIFPVVQFWTIEFFETVNAVVVVLLTVNITMLVCGLLEHAIHQLKELRRIILGISEVADEDIEESVRSVVKYHCAVIEFVEKINAHFGSQLVLHFTLTSIVAGLLGFEILMVNDRKESVMYGLHLIGWFIMLYNICYYGQLLIDESLMVNDRKESVMFGLHLIGWFIMLYNICYYGQLLIDESIGIAEDAYCTPWYNSPVNVQKQIKMIILRAQKPLTLRALNLGIMSHPTFLAVISSSYSYFTLLLKAKNS